MSLPGEIRNRELNAAGAPKLAVVFRDLALQSNIEALINVGLEETGARATDCTLLPDAKIVRMHIGPRTLDYLSQIHSASLDGVVIKTQTNEKFGLRSVDGSLVEAQHWVIVESPKIPAL